MSQETNTNLDEQLNQLYEEMEEKEMGTKTKSKPEEQMEKILEGMEGKGKTRRKDGNELLRFFCGLLLFGAGLFMVFQNIVVSSSMGYGSIFRLGSFNIPNGTIMIPLLIGIALLFLCDRKLWGWMFIAVGIVIIIAAILLSVSIQWRTSSGWVFFIMFAMVFAGGAMMLRELFRSE